MPVSSVTEHWIKPDAVTINLNHFGDPDYLQVSVLAGAVVMAFKQDVIAYNAAHNYRTWPLQAANTYLETTSAYNVYARLTRSEVNASALIVYDPILRDIKGRPISHSEKGEEVLGEADPTYFYVFLGQISSSVGSSGQSISREWIVNFRFGQLNTSEQLNDVNALLFKLFTPHFEDPLDPSKLTWIEAKSHIGVNGGVTMFVDNDDIDLPVIYDGLPIDNVTLYWDNGVLKAKGGEGGGGGVADSIAWVNVSGKPSWITDTKPIYNYNEIKNTPDLNVFVTGTALNKTLADYATLTYLTGELKKYVTIKDDQDIVGVKNFLNGIKISHMPIRKLQDDVIYIDANVVVRGGVTMYYQDGEVDLPSIIDEIGIAGYDGKKLGLVSFSSSQFSIDAKGNVTIKGGSTGLDTAQLKEYLDSNKYTTETWVKSQGYASASSLSTLQNKVNDFLEGSDTDTIINKWKELEAFLSGLSESDNLATILGTKANQSALDATNAILATKWTTDNNLINQWNTAYGWGNHASVGYALKSYVDNNFVTLGTKQTITGEKNFTDGLKVNGSPIVYDATNKYWKLEGDLLVTGGVSMYSDDSEFTPSTIMDGVVVDGTSIRKNPTTGALEVIGGSGATVKYPLSWSGFNQGSYDGSVAQSFYIPTKLSEFVNDKSFATTSDLSGYLRLSGGTMSGSLGITSSSVPDGAVGLWGTSTLYLKASDKVSFYNSSTGKFNEIIHLGNIGNQSVNYSNSAGKLQTSRTIWGQSFDGTGNVSGNLTINNGKLIFADKTYIAYGHVYLPSSDGTNSWNVYDSKHATLFNVRSNGNVLIGAITDSGYKLDITNKDTNNVFIARGKNSYFRVVDKCIMGIESHNGGWVLYSGPASGEAARFEVMDKNLGWVTTGWRLFSNGNMLIGNGQNNGYKLDVNGTIHTNSSLWIDNIEVKKSQNDVLYIDGNLVVRGGVTMYSEGEVDIPTLMDSIAVDSSMYNSGGVIGVNRATTSSVGVASFNPSNFTVDANGMVSLTSAPSSGASNLGELLNVDDSIDATASVDRILYQPRGSSEWTWRELPRDGVVGDYLPLSGGTLTGGVVIAPSASYTTAITDSCTVLKLGSDTSSMNGYNSGLGFNALQRYSSHYLLHLHAWIGLSPCINSAGSELYDLIFATNGSTTVNTSPIERMRITHDGSVKIQRLFFGNTNEINSTDGSTLCLNYEGTGNILMSNNGQGVVVATGWNGLSSTTQQRLRKSMFSVRGGIFSYMEDVMSNAAAYVFDKPGMHFTGIGSNGEADTIYFGAVDTTNLYSWVSYSQIWKFGGSIITTGGITMYSDKRKKTILNHVELSLKQIANAPLIEHYYNSDQEKTTHVGSIAQYWAGLNDWFCKLDNEGYYTMEIQNCALASAISIARHLEKYESKTDKKIRMLKKRVQELEDKLEKLEGGNYGNHS